MKKPDTVTVGNLLTAIEKTADLERKTFLVYAAKFRCIIAGIIGLKNDEKKHDCKGNGHKEWLQKIERTKLHTITPNKIQQWRKNFITAAGNDPRERAAAIRTANSYINNAKCLFSAKHVQHCSLPIPKHHPFEGIRLEGGRIARYHSEINAEWLLVAAQNELALPPPGSIDLTALKQAKEELRTTYLRVRSKTDKRIKCCYKKIYNLQNSAKIAKSKREQFKILLLALGAGLRRNEIDKLEWSSILFDRSVIRIQPTLYFQPKTDDSTGNIDVDPDLLELLRSYFPYARDEFVINGNRPRPEASYPYYRCNFHFEGLTKWLRSKGIKSHSPIHTLRKEFGSEICAEAGIFAASIALRHSSIKTAWDSYLDKKQRVTFPIGTYLKKPSIKAVDDQDIRLSSG